MRFRGAAVAALVAAVAMVVAAVVLKPHPGAAGRMAGMDMGANAGHWQEVAGAPFRATGKTRTYYVGADVVVWNYAPKGRNEITGAPFDRVADTYVQTGPGRIGSRYLKCLYRGYTDASFTRLAPRPADEAYLGFLGPVIRAEVGDTIRVVFRNACPFPVSVHPHGVLYAKDSEGAPYDDGTSGADKADDDVPTGGRHTYAWKVPERAGSGPGDGSSVMWMYHSHSDEIADTYAGLMGPIEITRRGMARPDGSPKDVDREVFALFSVMNENLSPFLAENLHRFATPPFPRDPDDDEFQESNLMHSINVRVRERPAAHDAEGRARPLVPDEHGHRGRPAHAALARQHRDRERDAHGHGQPAARVDGRRRHGPGQRRDLALPLPRERPHPRRDADPVRGHRLTADGPRRPSAAGAGRLHPPRSLRRPRLNEAGGRV
jgi:hypothetical protein